MAVVMKNHAYMKIIHKIQQYVLIAQYSQTRTDIDN